MGAIARFPKIEILKGYADTVLTYFNSDSAVLNALTSTFSGETCRSHERHLPPMRSGRHQDLPRLTKMRPRRQLTYVLAHPITLRASCAEGLSPAPERGDDCRSGHSLLEALRKRTQ